MNSIDAAIIEASIVEARLAAYDEALGRIREVMARVGQKNQAIHTANNNARLLLDQLNLVIVSKRNCCVMSNCSLQMPASFVSIAFCDVAKFATFKLVRYLQVAVGHFDDASTYFERSRAARRKRTTRSCGRSALESDHGATSIGLR